MSNTKSTSQSPCRLKARCKATSRFALGHCRRLPSRASRRVSSQNPSLRGRGRHCHRGRAQRRVSSRTSNMRPTSNKDAPCTASTRSALSSRPQGKRHSHGPLPRRLSCESRGRRHKLSSTRTTPSNRRAHNRCRTRRWRMARSRFSHCTARRRTSVESSRCASAPSPHHRNPQRCRRSNQTNPPTGSRRGTAVGCMTSTPRGVGTARRCGQWSQRSASSALCRRRKARSIRHVPNRRPRNPGRKDCCQ
mmetsp:Transcript_11719/g.31617  ORF Transcript_11719/g.31617 Transcript_11719/m.31617 type:complete len:249 (+) Transcript_11719:549-1295(+)